MFEAKMQEDKTPKLFKDESPQTTLRPQPLGKMPMQAAFLLFDKYGDSVQRP